MVMAFPFREVALRPAPTGSFSRTCSLPGAHSNGEREGGLTLPLRPGFSSGSWARNSAQDNRDCCPLSDLPACSLPLVPLWWIPPPSAQAWLRGPVLGGTPLLLIRHRPALR